MFQTTRWSLIIESVDGQKDQQRILSDLCSAYRRPVFTFIRRFTGCNEDAEDLTQAFFLVFLEKDYVHQASPERGRFRSFLLASVRNFLANAHDYAARSKRGGGTQMLSIADADDLRSAESPEHEFERTWALTVLNRAISCLHQEALTSGRERIFNRLREFLIEQPVKSDYERAAIDLGMRTNTVSVAVHRLRARLKLLVRSELIDTLEEEIDADSEMHVLETALMR